MKGPFFTARERPETIKNAAVDASTGRNDDFLFPTSDNLIYVYDGGELQENGAVVFARIVADGRNLKLAPGLAVRIVSPLRTPLRISAGRRFGWLNFRCRSSISRCIRWYLFKSFRV